MGLGKTNITLYTCEELFRQGAEQGLVIVPASLKYQWKKAIERFTDSSVLVVDGTKPQRERLYASNEAVRYVVLSYNNVVDDWRYVRDIARDFIVLDEATYIKSFKAQRSKFVKKLDAEFKFALTGTPVENRPEELYSIMQFLNGDVLGRYDLFDRAFIERNPWGQVKYYKNLKTLHNVMQDWMIRKTEWDDDVRPYMPSVLEKSIYVELNPKLQKLYRTVANELLVDLALAQNMRSWDLWSHYNNSQGLDPTMFRIMSKLSALRQICAHPSLLQKGESEYAHSLPIIPGDEKIDETVALIEEILGEDDKNKIVLFSFYPEILNILEAKICGLRGNIDEIVKFHGGMNATERDNAKEKFLSRPDVRIFLSTDAGGYGVDLPNANYLISFDLPGSSGAYDQRNARIIRASSEFSHITLINILIKGSIEERQYDSLAQKRRIAAAVVDGEVDETGTLELTLSSLTEYLQM